MFPYLREGGHISFVVDPIEVGINFSDCMLYQETIGGFKQNFHEYTIDTIVMMKGW